jgi:bifunctional DNA-binding transcriptional regulator/antitoxin component of YhaV-PrlF toxin-antitoxin module
LREKAKLKTGDRLATITGCDEDGEICCFILVKAEILDREVSKIISPMLMFS